MLATRDAEHSETRLRWRHAAESAVWPQIPLVWRLRVRSVYEDSGHWSRSGCTGDFYDPFVNWRSPWLARSYERAWEHWTLRKLHVPATRRLEHLCWAGNQTQLLSLYFPNWKFDLQRKDQRKLAAASRQTMSGRKLTLLEIRHVNVGTVCAQRNLQLPSDIEASSTAVLWKERLDELILRLPCRYLPPPANIRFSSRSGWEPRLKRTPKWQYSLSASPPWDNIANKERSCKYKAAESLESATTHKRVDGSQLFVTRYLQTNAGHFSSWSLGFVDWDSPDSLWVSVHFPRSVLDSEWAPRMRSVTLTILFICKWDHEFNIFLADQHFTLLGFFEGKHNGLPIFRPETFFQLEPERVFCTTTAYHWLSLQWLSLD